MKYFFLLLFTCCIISCTSEQNESESAIQFFPSIEIREGLYYKTEAEVPYSGFSQSTYSDGKPYVSATFKKGKLHGTYTAWHLSGQKMGESNYMNGKKEGLSIAWHENGNKASEISFINDEREGKLEVFYPTGEQSTEAFFKNDQLDSTYTRWNMDGNVVSVEVYEVGVVVE
ncbi:MAG: hypothetical protein WEA79_02405 [Balneolaceae bacterium]